MAGGPSLSERVTGWRWAAARAVGTSHQTLGSPCQDAVAVRAVAGAAGPVLIACVSDGAGSARCSREGSRVVVREVVARAAAWFAAEAGLPSEEEVRAWLESARARIARLAAAREATPRDFAATMVAAFATPAATLIAHVGDGACVLDGDDDGWAIGSWPASGEYAGTTYFVTDAVPQLRVTLHDRSARALALFSDGIEHLVLQNAARRAHPEFFDTMFAPVRASTADGCDRALSRGLRGYLAGETVNARTDDDKSLILAVRA